MAIFTTDELKARHQKLLQVMEQEHLDAIFVFSADHVYYLSGVPLLWEVGRPMWTLFRADGAATIIGAEMEQENMEKNSWITDVRTFDDSDSSVDAIVRMAIDFLASAAQPPKRIGLEKSLLNMKMYEGLVAAFPDVVFIEIGSFISELRMIKSPQELALMKLGGKVVEIGGHAFVDAIGDGVSEMEITATANLAMNKALTDLYPKNFLAVASSFSLCHSGMHTLTPHQYPSTRRIRPGDVIELNCYAIIWGYFVSLERVFVYGPASSEQKRAIDIVTESNIAAQQALRAGVSFSEVDRVAKQVLLDAGYGVELHRHGTGATLGTLIGSAGRSDCGELRSYNKRLLAKNMTLTIEPGIYIKGLGGFRQHTAMLVDEDGASRLVEFPYYPLD